MRGKRVVLGVTGGISAYKAVEVVRRLTAEGADVHVVMTHAATRFVGPLTFRELSYNPVATDLFEEPAPGAMMRHLHLAETADAVVIAPATADFMAKMAYGLAGDLLSTLVLATKAPVLVAPAMDADMWTNPVTQENVARLRALGRVFVGPNEGPLARGNVGLGRLAEPEEIVEACRRLLSPAPQDLEGARVLVTAGPTREPLDPVRYISNRSSGKMGYALAEAARSRGASVTLVSGPTALPPPAGVETVRVETALEMRDAVMARAAAQDILIMAAAVGDYRAARPAAQKLSKTGDEGLTLELAQNPDIAAEVGAAKSPRQVVVSFAAETQDAEASARRKLARKRSDLVVANDVTAPGAGFETDTNQVTIVGEGGRAEALPLMPKSEVAHKILDRAAALWREKRGKA